MVRMQEWVFVVVFLCLAFACQARPNDPLDGSQRPRPKMVRGVTSLSGLWNTYGSHSNSVAENLDPNLVSSSENLLIIISRIVQEMCFCLTIQITNRV